MACSDRPPRLRANGTFQKAAPIRYERRESVRLISGMHAISIWLAEIGVDSKSASNGFHTAVIRSDRVFDGSLISAGQIRAHVAPGNLRIHVLLAM